MKLTNRQIVEAAAVLEQWTPSVSFKTRMALSRNLQRLQAAVATYEWDKNRLQLGVIGDKSVVPEGGKPVQLTAAELEKLNPDFMALTKAEQEIEIVPVGLYDSSESNLEPDPGIDVAKTPVPNEVLSRLLGNVLVD